MILIVAEYANGKLSKSAYEMTQAARGLGRESPVALLVLGSKVAAVAAQAAMIADQVLVADLPTLGTVRRRVVGVCGCADRARRRSGSGSDRLQP